MCCGLISCTYGLLRSLPWLSLVSFGVALFGGCLALSQKNDVQVALQFLEPVLSSATTVEYVEFLWLLYTVSLLVDLLALLASFCASGKTRECCFANRENWCCWMPQFLASHFYLVLCVALFGLFLAHFVFTGVLMTTTPIILVLNAACTQGRPAVETVVGALQSAKILKGGTGDTVSKAIGGICSFSVIDGGVAALTVGTAICTVGQVMLLTFASNNFIKVQLQPRLDAARKPLLSDKDP